MGIENNVSDADSFLVYTTSTGGDVLSEVREKKEPNLPNNKKGLTLRDVSQPGLLPMTPAQNSNCITATRKGNL